MANMMFCRAHILRFCHEKDNLAQGLEVLLEWHAMTAWTRISISIVIRTHMRQLRVLGWSNMVLVCGSPEYRFDESYFVTTSDVYRAQCQLASPSLTIHPTISPCCATTKPWVSLDGTYRTLISSNAVIRPGIVIISA